MFSKRSWRVRAGYRAGLTALAVLSFLTACGKDDAAEAAADDAPSTPTAPLSVSAAAPAHLPAMMEARSGTSCGASPAWGTFDFWGVGLGMPKDEVDRLLECLDSEFVTKHDLERFTVRGYQVPLPIISVRRGNIFSGKREENLIIYFAGVPDHLRVVHIYKQSDYSSKEPGSRRIAEQGMATAYGPFSRLESNLLSLNTYGRVAATNGNDIQPGDRRRSFHLCATFAASKTSGFNRAWKPEKFHPSPEGCGLAIAFTVQAKSNRDDEMTRFSMGTMDYDKMRLAVRESLEAANLPGGE